MTWRCRSCRTDGLLSPRNEHPLVARLSGGLSRRSAVALSVPLDVERSHRRSEFLGPGKRRRTRSGANSYLILATRGLGAVTQHPPPEDDAERPSESSAQRLCTLACGTDAAMCSLRLMQLLNPHRELARNGKSGFANHSSARVISRYRSAVEADPRRRIDNVSVAINEVGHPQSAPAKIDRYFPARAAPKHLALYGLTHRCD